MVTSIANFALLRINHHTSLHDFPIIFSIYLSPPPLSHLQPSPRRLISSPPTKRTSCGDKWPPNEFKTKHRKSIHQHIPNENLLLPVPLRGTKTPATPACVSAYLRATAAVLPLLTAAHNQLWMTLWVKITPICSCNFRLTVDFLTIIS